MIEVTFVVCAGLTSAVLLRRRAAALRHWVLAVALACAASVPLFQLMVPAWRPWPPGQALDAGATSTALRVFRLTEDAAGPSAGVRAEPGMAGHAAQPSSSDRPSAMGLLRAWPWRGIALGVWIAGLVITVGALTVGLGRLRWLASRSRPLTRGVWPETASLVGARLGLRRPVTLLENDHSTLLVTWGLRRPRVMVPRAALTWTEDRVRVVLCHELSHIMRGDWITQLVAEFVRSLYWFNPLVWIAATRLRHESERACDDEVLRSGVPAVDYAGHLVALARELGSAAPSFLDTNPAPAMVRPSSLERRVTAMLNGSLDRRQSTRALRASMTAALIGLTAIVVSLTASQGPSFSGSITDQQNSGVPDTQITLINVDTQLKTEVRTDQNGRFAVQTLPAGTYVVEAQRPGFRAIREQVTLSGSPVERKYSLILGTVSESITVSYDPTTPASPAPSRPAAARPAGRSLQDCTSSSSGGSIRPPRKVKHVAPIYPPNLAGTGSEGVVVMESRIRTDGTTGDTRVLKSVNPDLDAAALESVRQWVFEPTLLNCVPVEVVMTVTVNFVEKK